ncbi:MAG: prepilin-type N-terminal cleavage/methylation domain-containing protein [Phycisphaeraceae bacterium]
MTARRGFSLVEVMIAMGVFAVGFVAVAAMFPAGVILQKQTISDVESQLVARNAAAMVRARKLTFRATAGTGIDLIPTSGTGVLQTFASISGSLGTRWTIGDRSYPTAQGAVTERRYYWVPMIRRTKSPASVGDWMVLVFVLRNDPGSDYSYTGYAFSTPVVVNASDGNDVPKVVGVNVVSASGDYFNMGVKKNDLDPVGGNGVPDQIRPGDWVADNNGVSYQVIEADVNGFRVSSSIPPTIAPATVKLWYAPPPPGKTSPCTRIIQLSGVIKEVAP